MPMSQSRPLMLIVVLATLLSLCRAQVSVQAPAKEATGAVSGHVLCADTNLPARMASVVLQPVYDEPSPPPRYTPGSYTRSGTMATIVETMLDGSYTIKDVKPGNYFVIAEKMGYLSPLAQLTREQINKPNEANAASMARLLTPVSVTANHTASADIRIFKGGAITGLVRFDDGSVHGNAEVALLHKTRDAKWEPFRTKLLSGPYGSNRTDDQGRYRFAGLPDGEYLVKTSLNVIEIKMDHVFEDSGSSSINGGYSLDVYSPGVLRQREAKPVTLGEGEEADLVDIEVPVSTLHTVSGLVADSTGHAVNSATVGLVHTDDSSLLASAQVGKEDDGFHFYFVPEGEYRLEVWLARDVKREEVPNCANCWPATRTEEKTVREYEEAKQPIIIHGDMTGVAVTVKPRTVKEAAPATP